MDRKVVIYSYWSPEELTGIGRYNGELIDWLISKEIDVTSISNVPFYPYWKKYQGFSNFIYSSSQFKFRDIRTWVYIPKSPGAIKKILSEVSFFLTSILAFLIHWKSIKKSNIIIVVNPPFFLGIFPLLFSIIHNTKVLFHIQDLQVDAARELGLLPKTICFFLEGFEKFLLKKATFVSTISLGMKQKILNKGLNKDILLLPNWSNLNEIKPGVQSSWLHDHLGMDTRLKLIVYSGNIGEKQGLEIVLETAKKLEDNKEIQFIILGAGLYKSKLKEIATSMGVMNLTIGDLVPKERLLDMLQSSYLQLVIQKSIGADSFFPSKLTNILAAGCVSIVTANKDTGLYNSLIPKEAAIVIQPDSAQKLSQAILGIIDNPKRYIKVKLNARNWAENNLSINYCLKPLLEII